MERPGDCIVAIFGVSGDLAKRMLVPALFMLHRRKMLPERFALLGLGRTDLNDESFRRMAAEELLARAGEEERSQEEVDGFVSRLFYESMDTSSLEAYALAKKRLESLGAEIGIPGNHLYYLSTPPSLYQTIAAGLGSQGLNKEDNGWKRIIVEKPFGKSLKTAKELNRDLHKVFNEPQIYRIDHYLGKETVQNIVALRFANEIFESLWNRHYVERVEITAAEHIGVEKRGGYYDGSGALRDMVQNHLLQLLGTIAMEPPSVFNADTMRNEAVKVFNALRPISPSEVDQYVVRGQYTASTMRGEKAADYRNEKNVSPDSRTETYVALKAYVDNWRWGGVPFYIRSGKRLPTRVSEAVIHFKRTPHALFRNRGASDISNNQLVIRIQPDEGILLRYGMKVPGSGFEIQNVSMDFHYSELSNVHIPSAYERLLVDCMAGDATLYARSDAVEACWAYVDPILEAWQNNPQIPVYGYPAGTWGPLEAQRLFDDPSIDWRYPCKNLSNDGVYCEL